MIKIPIPETIDATMTSNVSYVTALAINSIIDELTEIHQRIKSLEHLMIYGASYDDEWWKAKDE